MTRVQGFIIAILAVVTLARFGVIEWYFNLALSAWLGWDLVSALARDRSDRRTGPTFRVHATHLTTGRKS